MTMIQVADKNPTQQQKRKTNKQTKTTKTQSQKNPNKKPRALTLKLQSNAGTILFLCEFQSWFTIS